MAPASKPPTTKRARDSMGRFIKGAPAHTGPFRLLDLPPELRNRVYQLVLVRPTRIQLEGSDRLQPPLLHVNKQVRVESASIYYGENFFDFPVYDSDGTAMIPFRKILRRYRTKQVRGNFRFLEMRRASNWVNLAKWVEASHEDHRLACMPLSGDYKGVTMKVAAAAFGIMRKMKDRQWSEIEAVLEEFHKGIVAVDAGWA